MTVDLQRQTALLGWYARHARRLPWRAPTGQLADPYGVVVSELMLQQTRVDTVIDYFARWVQRWPHWQALAAAPLDDVLAQWTGLGYYNRARNLHRTAQTVVAEYGGVLPRDVAALAALPGLGPYTVGAVRSIAFGQPAALVDGNVARVLARWYGLRHDPMAGTGKAQVWQWAADHLQPATAACQHPQDWNQALMELGATVCTPKQPQCQQCPVATGCVAHALDLTLAIPPPRQRTTVVPIAACYYAVQRLPQPQDRDGILVLLGKRGEHGRWAGLWEPPGAEGPDAAAQMLTFAEQCGLQAQRPLPTLVHVLTHRRYAVQATAGTLGDRPLPDPAHWGYTAWRWTTVAEALANTSGLSRLGQKIVGLLAAPPPLL